MRVRGARAISSHFKLIVMSMIVCVDSVFGFVLLVPISCCSMHFRTKSDEISFG